MGCTGHRLPRVECMFVIAGTATAEFRENLDTFQKAKNEERVTEVTHASQRIRFAYKNLVTLDISHFP